jgi:hypothetical protein
MVRTKVIAVISVAGTPAVTVWDEFNPYQPFQPLMFFDSDLWGDVDMEYIERSYALMGHN